MSRKLFLLTVLALVCLLSSCTHYYYAPNTLHAPFLQKQHDTQVNVGIVGGDEFSGWEANALYSPVKYAAVMLNHFQVRHGSRSFEDNEDWGEGRLTEFAVGAYLPANEINCFSVTWPPKRIIAGGRRLVFYDYDEPTDHHLADDQACLCVLYNSIFYTFITAHPKCIKVWDASNGELISVFRDLTAKEITCICLDDRKRKLFVGDQKGRLFSINIKNGAKMKKFKKSKKKNKRKRTDKDDISSLYFWGDEEAKKNILIAASWDGRVRLYDDSTSEQEGAKRYSMKKHKDSVNFIDFKPS